MDAQEKLYKEGFNSGYFLAHDPELARIILDAAMSPKEPNEYAYGLSNGHDAYLAEKIIAQNKEEIGHSKTVPAKDELPKEKLAGNYQKGFNSGYFISKHEPELAQKLFSSAPSQSEYYKGFVGGKQEHEMEKIRERLKDISKNKPPEPDKGKGRER